MSADATMDMGETRSHSRSSFRTRPGPSFQLWVRASLWPRVRPVRDQGRRSSHGQGRHSEHNYGWAKPGPSPRS
ncbi:unnamed protein product [Prunus armeniaca]